MIKTKHAFLFIALLSMLLLLGCNTEQKKETGFYKSSLYGVSAQGITYRLRSATFDVAGPTAMSLNSENYLNQQAIEVALEVGNYSVTLLTGWTLERDVNGVFEPVNATLQSTATQNFTIVDGQPTAVVYLFRAGDDVVPIGEGVLSIQIAVDDSSSENTDALCADGIDNDGDGAVDCDDSDCTGLSVCLTPGVCGDGIINTGEVCDNGAPSPYTCEDVQMGAGDISCNATCDNFTLAACEETASAPAGWTCPVAYYGTADGCDCGCGIVDPDCASADVAECQYCGTIGACDVAATTCPSTIDPLNNAICVQNDCGNGVIEGMEECDGTDMGGNTCETMSVAFGGGALGCNADCTFDTSACTEITQVCGDGIVSGSEVCDGGSPYACEDVQMGAGDISCNATCDNFTLAACEETASAPAGWTCPVAYYGTADGCDCGCGIVDPDCASADVAECQYCGTVGACDVAATACPSTIDPLNNAVCQ